MYTLNAVMFLEEAARHVGEKVSIVGNGQKLTYSELNEQADRFASALKGSGVEPGDKVALLMPNVPAFAVCHYGILKLGAVSVPLSVTNPGPEVQNLLLDSGAVALIAYEPQMDAALEGIKGAKACKQLIIVNVPGSEVCPKPGKRWVDMLAEGKPGFERALTQGDDPAVILYTSGTTGRPKGVVVSHFNLYYEGETMAFKFWEVGPDDVVLMVAPGSHLFGQTLMNITWAAHGTLVMMPRFEPQVFLETIQAQKVSFFAGVPTLANLMLYAPFASEYDLSSLRKVMFGGAPMSQELMDAFRDRFSLEVITGYGLTEGSPLTYFSAEMMADAPPGSVGKVSWGTQVRIVDEQEEDVTTGEFGEIIVRGPQIFLRYHNLPKETADAFRGGWFHTGDLGRMDEDGNVFIIERLKDMIKRSGYAVFPAEVERALLEHPAVAEAAVIGVPDETRGEEIKGFVVLKPNASITEEELIEFTKGQIAAYKYPRMIEFCDSLPKSSAGKVLRRALRSEATIG